MVKNRFALERFQRRLKAYRRQHPKVPFAKAQRTVSRMAKKKKKAPTRKARPVKKKRSRVTGLTTRSKSHVDRNRFKSVNVQIGSARKHLAAAKRALKHEYGKLQGELLTATTAKRKKRLRKQITQKGREYRKL